MDVLYYSCLFLLLVVVVWTSSSSSLVLLPTIIITTDAFIPTTHRHTAVTRSSSKRKVLNNSNNSNNTVNRKKRRRRRRASTAVGVSSKKQQHLLASSSSSSSENNNGEIIIRLPNVKNMNFFQILQSSCHNPHDLLENVGRHLTQANDPDAKVSSLVLVRLLKMLIVIHNRQYECHDDDGGGKYDDSDSKYKPKPLSVRDVLDTQVVSQICNNLSHAIAGCKNEDKVIPEKVDWCIEGVKAAAVISRILYESSLSSSSSSSSSMLISDLILQNIVDSCEEGLDVPMLLSEPRYLSGLQWSFDTFSLQNKKIQTKSKKFQDAVLVLDLPFRIRPGFIENKICCDQTNNMESSLLTLKNIKTQVNFKREDIKTTGTQKVVVERRETAWQGYEYIPGFAYSGKIMETQEFSPVVLRARDILETQMGSKYDCCLLNFYPNGDSGMRYHIDPDQGQLWGFDTCVVSVGATRRFAFREIPNGAKNKDNKSSLPHNFVVMNGDVTHMFGRCQFEYQHAVKTAEEKGECASRSSLVFKQSLDLMGTQNEHSR